MATFRDLLANAKSQIVEIDTAAAEARIQAGDVFVLDLDSGGCALEIKSGGDFLGCVLDRVFHFDQIGFADGVKRGHSGVPKRVRQEEQVRE
jgi:hypothetical protein